MIMATILSRSWIPDIVPLVIASIAERYSAGGAIRPDVTSPVSGTMILAITIAAGALMIDAVRICPSALGITPPSMLA